MGRKEKKRERGVGQKGEEGEQQKEREESNQGGENPGMKLVR